MKGIDDIYVVIPAYEPGQELISLCDSLYRKGIRKVLIVDDGSGSGYQSIFADIKSCFKYGQHIIDKKRTGFRHLHNNIQ